MATCSYIPWSTATSHFTATYLGDFFYAPSTSNTLTLTASYTYDASVVLTFSGTQLTYPGETQSKVCVTRATSSAPTGAAQILDGNTVLQTLTLGGDGCAGWHISGLHAGTHYMRAFYSGDSNNPGGYSAITNVVVSQVPVQMGVFCSSSTLTYGNNLQCNVSTSSTAGSPPGSIVYSLDGGPSAFASLSGGNTSFVITKPAVGNHALSVAYPGNADFAPAPAKTVNFTVTH
jgi:hypothetical protein